jgi:hypothetical protein
VTGQLFEPKREHVCSCGFREPIHPERTLVFNAHMADHGYKAERVMRWTETDGFADDRKRSRLPEQEAV